MSHNNSTNSPPVPLRREVDGQLKDYTPTVHHVLTYTIPRVHVSVSKDPEFIKDRLRTFFNTELAYNKYDFTQVERIDFIPREGDSDFVKAVVYHKPMSAADKHHHVARTTEHKFNRWHALNRQQWRQMTLVSRITETIFSGERNLMAEQVHFVHNGRPAFWELLPNLYPLSPAQRAINEQLSDLCSKLNASRQTLIAAGKPMPIRFDYSLLLPAHIDTAWTPLPIAQQLFNDKLGRLFNEYEIIHDHMTSIGL